MDSLLYSIAFVRLCVPASTGRSSEVLADGLQIVPARRRSVQGWACRSSSSQLKASTITSNTSPTDESTSKDGVLGSSFNPLPLIFSHSIMPTPLKFLWITRKEDQASESRDHVDLTHTGNSGDDQVEGEEPLGESEVSTAMEEFHSQKEIINETGVDSDSEGKELSNETEVENDNPPQVCETHVTETGSLTKDMIGPPPPLRYWMSKIAALWPDPNHFKTRSAPIHMPLSSESLNGSFDSSSTHVKESSSAPSSSEYDKDDVACSLNGLYNCSLEVPYKRVLHTKESFSKFLQETSLGEIKDFMQLAFLCDTAYMIPSIQPNLLMKYHHLRLVTTSLDKKAEAEIKAKEAELSKKCDTKAADRSGGNGSVNSQNQHTTHTIGTQLEKCAEQPINIHLGNVQSSSAGAPDARCESKDIRLSSLAHNNTTEDQNSSVLRQSEEIKSMDQGALLSMAPATVPMLAEEETKLTVAKDAPSLHTCPCEWFVCDGKDERDEKDEKETHTRLFVIQGSESLASWQANLFFEPTPFEGLDVFVHRGIYDAAKALYDQVLPEVIDHLSRHGDCARVRFTGHSLGGSLAALLALMLQVRGVLSSTTIYPVVTFGSPFIMCGGDYLLQKMGLPKDHIKSVIMHRDVVPRAFSCDYPDHVAEVLRRLNGRFRDLPCLNNQKLLYAPMGQIYILQPEASAAPFHPLLPDCHGLYTLKHPSHGDELENATELRAAQRAFLNLPHPLDMLGDPGAYGFDGTVSRDHDPRSYCKTIHLVSRHKAKIVRHEVREWRRERVWPSVIVGPSSQKTQLWV